MEGSSVSRPIRFIILVGFLATIMAVGVMGWVAFTNVNNLVDALAMAVKPDAYVDALNDTEETIIDAERSMRAFTLTNNSQDLTKYLTSVATIDDKLNKLENLSSGSLKRKQQFDTVFVLINQKMEILDSMRGLSDPEGITLNIFEKLSEEIKVASEEVYHQESLDEPLPEATHDKVVLEKIDSIRSSGEKPPVEVEPEKKKRNIFGRLADKIKGGNKDKEREDKDSADPTADTVIIVRNVPVQVGPKGKVVKAEVVEELQETAADLNSERIIEQFFRQETLAELTAADKSVTVRIRGMIAQMELSYRADQQKLVNQWEMQAANTIEFFKLFGVVIISLILVLITIIFNDISRNRRLQKKLSLEKARAEKLARAKEEFLANMSHEIRTPMNAVIGFADQLNDTTLTRQQNHFLQPIRNSARYLLGLINDILDYSKIESGNFRMETIGFRPGSVIQEVRNTFTASAERKGIGLRCEMNEGVPPVLMGDPLRLQQMLFNLVSNAIKFTEEGEVSLIAQKETTDDNHAVMKFTVSDTGIGIPKEQLEKVFADFQQVDSSTTRKYGGTGLGLSITKRLAEMAGGTVGIVSEPGKGTSVSVTIPYLIGTEDDLEELTPVQIGNKLLLKGKKALIADDEPYNRLLIQAIMDKWKVEADVVENGRELVDLVEQGNDYDFILMDLQMPEMDGFEAAKKVRSEHGVEVPILALTATATPEEILSIESIGMDGHLLKPFREQELFARLVKLLNIDVGDSQILEKVENEADVVNDSEKGYQLERLFHLANNDEGFVINMLNIFVTNAGMNTQLMQEGAENKNWDKVGMAAHKMIPPARHLGLLNIVDQLKTIELNIQDQEGLEEIPPMVQVVSQQIEETIASIKEDIQDLQKNRS